MNWTCPRCDGWLTSPENRMHDCPGLGGMRVFFVLAGTNAKMEAVEREDYVDGEQVQTDNEGRPIMSVITTRDDGRDCVVYAPTATAKGEMHVSTTR